MTDALLGLGVLVLVATTTLALLGTLKYRPHPKMPTPIRVGWRVVQGIGLAWPVILAAYALIVSLTAIGRAARVLLSGG